MRPLRSTIRPRGAWRTMSRRGFGFAGAGEWWPDSPGRYQSRKKTTPNMISATPPMIATRSASCGDIGVRVSESRYIIGLAVHLEAAQAERAGRGRLLAAAAHALERVDRQHRAQHAPDEGEQRQRQR